MIYLLRVICALRVIYASHVICHLVCFQQVALFLKQFVYMLGLLLLTGYISHPGISPQLQNRSGFQGQYV